MEIYAMVISVDTYHVRRRSSWSKTLITTKSLDVFHTNIRLLGNHTHTFGAETKLTRRAARNLRQVWLKRRWCIVIRGGRVGDDGGGRRRHI